MLTQFRVIENHGKHVKYAISLGWLLQPGDFTW